MKVLKTQRSRATLGCWVGPLAMLLLGACGEDVADSNSSKPTAVLKVMTRNLFLGAEFDEIISAPTLAEIPARVNSFWESVQKSDLPGRMQLLVDEIAHENPDILAVQELELFRLQVPSNFDARTPFPDAETVAPSGDLLALLQTEMAVRGLDFGPPVAINTLTDTELPAMDSAGAAYDFRLTDRDAIFVRPGILPGAVKSAAFPTFVTIPIGGLSSGVTVKLLRGYTVMEGLANGTAFTFINTHLEVGGRVASFQEAQAEDLVKALFPVQGPVVLVGDFNSSADGSTTKSYASLTRTFTDAWSVVNPSDPGVTCCTQLANPSPAHGQRIDLVLYRGKVRPESMHVIGQDPAKRTLGALWPSDHLGVVATLTIGP